MKQDDKINICETEYYKCFSEAIVLNNIIRFRDEKLKDMYSHNFTYFKKIEPAAELQKNIEDEISLRISEGSDFCNISIICGTDKLMLPVFKYTPQISVNGFYVFDILQADKLETVKNASVEKVTNKKMLDDILYCDLQNDEERLGKDFCTRRCYRRGEVYLTGEGVNSYICYHESKVIGNCDLFIHNGTAKIEDFAVIHQYQRKGYGTTILKTLIDKAMNKKCDIIYLVTDEEDTAKEMYKKLGFHKVAEKIDLFFKI
ncbi:MAG: GNAT family N-acetyltransferase [Eubacteriales bacterium]